MSWQVLLDPMFHQPFVTGLLLAILLPLLGLYLRLRGEWLAALGFAHVAGAGAVLAPVLGLPVVAGALALSACAAAAKGVLRRTGNDAYALLILLGWSAMLLGAVHSQHGQLLGQALIDGQLYFVGRQHLVLSLLLLAGLLAGLPWLSRYLLREHMFPGHDRANGRPLAGIGAGFDLLVALAVALAATALGIMAAFALIFIPAWIAFGLAGSWRRAMPLACLLAVGCYGLAFVVAIALDLPFGPVLVMALLLLAPLRLVSGVARRL